MNIEENRLRTFLSWPSDANIDPARIAKAGFFYTGQALEVQCFLCAAKISEWNYGDQAMAKHRQAAPNCPFVLNPSTTSNKPLIITTGLSSLNTSNDNDNRADISSDVVRSQDPRTEYHTMAQRLRSFANWPIPSIVSPKQLAQSGFYYLQRSDIVECAFCGGVLMKWESSDNPDRIHRINFPYCRFYMRQNDDDELETAIKLELANVKLTSNTTSNTDATELGIQAHVDPKELKYATYKERLQTFQGWPKELKQTPEMLANAGFYYKGPGDQVRCFHCDGGLHSWVATDDVWTEHAQWFPKCGFVNLVRGQEFVKQCIKNRPPLDPSIFAGVAEDDIGNVSDTPPASSSTVLPSTLAVTEAFVDILLNTFPVTEALKFGLKPDIVKTLVRKRMEEIGVSYSDPDQLIEDVFKYHSLQETAQSQNQAPDSSSAELTHLLNQAMPAESLNNSLNSVTTSTDTNSGADAIENSTQAVTTIWKNSNNQISEKAKASKPKEKSSSKSDNIVSVEEENRRLKEARLCKICMDREVAVVFLPCGHLATCPHCAPSLTYCPMCRQKIQATTFTNIVQLQIEGKIYNIRHIQHMHAWHTIFFVTRDTKHKKRYNNKLNIIIKKCTISINS